MDWIKFYIIVFIIIPVLVFISDKISAYFRKSRNKQKPDAEQNKKEFAIFIKSINKATGSLLQEYLGPCYAVIPFKIPRIPYATLIPPMYYVRMRKYCIDDEIFVMVIFEPGEYERQAIVGGCSRYIYEAEMLSIFQKKENSEEWIRLKSLKREINHSTGKHAVELKGKYEGKILQVIVEKEKKGR